MTFILGILVWWLAVKILLWPQDQIIVLQQFHVVTKKFILQHGMFCSPCYAYMCFKLVSFPYCPIYRVQVGCPQRYMPLHWWLQYTMLLIYILYCSTKSKLKGLGSWELTIPEKYPVTTDEASTGIYTLKVNFVYHTRPFIYIYNFSSKIQKRF